MAQIEDGAGENKISAEFAARLARLEPQQKVRAIVLINIDTASGAVGRRQSHAERQAAIQAVRASAEQALGDIDTILERFDGERLASRPDALGSIPVTTTPAGVQALAASERVKAILEDQRIYPHPSALTHK